MYCKCFLAACTFSIASAGTAQEPPLSKAHDGRWLATVVCDDFRNDKGNLAKGYTVTVPLTITGGRIVGDRDRGYVSSGELQYAGEVREGGALTIRATGVTGKPEYTPSRVTPGTAFGYTLIGQLGETTGTATRQELRPCKATFQRSQ